MFHWVLFRAMSRLYLFISNFIHKLVKEKRDRETEKNSLSFCDYCLIFIAFIYNILYIYIFPHVIDLLITSIACRIITIVLLFFLWGSQFALNMRQEGKGIDRQDDVETSFYFPLPIQWCIILLFIVVVMNNSKHTRQQSNG